MPSIMKDRVDKLTDKIIRAFEPFSDRLLLERIAIPEDIDNPNAEMDLWVVGAEAQPLDSEARKSIVLRATASIPIEAVVQSDRHELSRLLQENLLDSPEFRHARVTAQVAAAAARSGGVPTEEEAQRN